MLLNKQNNKPQIGLSRLIQVDWGFLEAHA